MFFEHIFANFHIIDRALRTKGVFCWLLFAWKVTLRQKRWEQFHPCSSGHSRHVGKVRRGLAGVVWCVHTLWWWAKMPQLCVGCLTNFFFVSWPLRLMHADHHSRSFSDFLLFSTQCRPYAHTRPPTSSNLHMHERAQGARARNVTRRHPTFDWS